MEIVSIKEIRKKTKENAKNVISRAVDSHLGKINQHINLSARNGKDNTQYHFNGNQTLIKEVVNAVGLRLTAAGYHVGYPPTLSGKIPMINIFWDDRSERKESSGD